MLRLRSGSAYATCVKYRTLVAVLILAVCSLLLRVTRTSSEFLPIHPPLGEYAIPQIYAPCKLVAPIFADKNKDLPLKHVMLSLEVQGRTGNELFQWASAVGIAYKNRVRYCLHGLKLSRYFEGPFCAACHKLSPRVRKEIGFAVYEDISISQDITLDGYLQSFKYFKHVDIHRALRFKRPYQQQAQQIVNRINSTKVKTVVGVHIRRGDYTSSKQLYYLHFPCRQYFENAMNYYRNKYSDVRFIVVSNELPWVKSQAVFKKDDTFAVTTGDAMGDLAVLANCNHGIMSLGTFGWWSCYLAGGECIYYEDEFLLSHPLINGQINFEDYYLPHWKRFGAECKEG